MRIKLLTLFVALLVCSFSATAQTVNEAESSVSIEGNIAVVRLAVVSDRDAPNLVPMIELLDTADVVRSRPSNVFSSIKSGSQVLEFRLPIESILASATEDIAWYRLRYRIGSTSGVISMSQLIRDLFELRVIASKDILSGMTYRVRVRAVNPFTSYPEAGVTTDIWVDFELTGEDKKKLKLNGSGETDADGFAYVDFTVPSEAKLDGDGKIIVMGRKNSIVREAEEDLRVATGDLQFLMMTDKPIYQPEQTLNVRGILLKGGEAKAVQVGSELEFRISDEDDTVLYREKVKSSDFGIASISWQIPGNVKLGDYRIDIRDENDDQISGRRVKISRYDIPNFVVEAKALKPYYVPGENEAEVEIKADYLFGKPVTKGKVRIVQENKREWNWKEQKYDIDEGQIREGPTNAEGTFTAKFDLKDEQDGLKEDDWRKYRDIHFAAYLTDLTTNKTEQRRFDIRVTREPIHVYLIGASNSHHPNLPVIAYVSTFYADGSPAECDVEVTASIEDKDKFKTVGRVRTNAYGAGRIKMKRPTIGDPDDTLDFRLIARDKDGRRGTTKENVSFDEDAESIQIATEKTIYKPGETMNVSITSTIQSGPVYLDVVTGWSVLDSRFAVLKDGKAEIQIPYNGAFRGELKIAAFAENENEKLAQASRGVIFPARQGISVDAGFDKAVYKPGEEATVKYSVVDSTGNAIQSALGIVVMDKAVEERARTDADFGGMWRNYSGWLGYGDRFGGMNVKNLNELDLTKPISNDIQLVAEVILHDSFYYPNIFHSTNYDAEAKSIFGEAIKKQFKSIDAALKDSYERRSYEHAVNDESLNRILASHNLNLNLGELHDPWGLRYKARFSVEKSRDIVTVISAGPDKQFDTKDDFTAFTAGFEYFTPMGRTLDAVVKGYNARTGGFIRDEKTLFAELGIRELLDRFGRPYRIVFETEGRRFKLRLISSGPDGKFEKYDWAGDDFQVWSNQIDYFDAIGAKIADAQRAVKSIPANEAEFLASLKAAGIDFDSLRDGFGEPLYVIALQRSRYWDRVTLETVQNYGETKLSERRVIKPVTQQIVEFTIRSMGTDRTRGNYDDFTLTQIVHVLSEQTRDDPKPVPVIKPVSFNRSSGSITGVVTDPQGAVIPGATVTATNDSTGVGRQVTTSSDGRYLIANLDTGTYTITAESKGFMKAVISQIPVNGAATTEANVTLNVGGVAQMVTVTSSVEQTQTTSAANATTIELRQLTSLPINGRRLSAGVNLVTKSGVERDNSTPRLREYFPETLLWRPEVVTDANGKAELKFKMADNITTWKMYTIASTKNGKVGVAEKEVTAFQSFFADLDPPKFLTEGDEIYLPTQVRNYTEKRQKVDVTMDRAVWFSMLGPEKQQIDVDSNGSKNAVFGFRATTPIKDGKQRVTAIAQTDSDAIEKPVTVRPNGQEIVRTDSRFSAGEQKLEIAYPANALPRTQKLELKIYPNLYSQVTDSVQGLLERPYGCGEQTISSTYPNLMILKFVKPDTLIAKKARTFLQKGYERLLGYQVADGGFTYWGGKDTSDVALTAYAIRFLSDARSQIAVDEDVIKRAADWLIKQQRVDGSWTKLYSWERGEDTNRTKLITTYIARSLAMRKDADKNALKKALDYLRARNNEIDEPYALALYGLASLDAGDREAAEAVAKRLESMAITEGDAVYWKLETNTPFYGWGTAGRIETTALVTQLLIAIAKQQPSTQTTDLIGKATIFLLKNKDRYGVWYSTQTTINVLDAFLASLGNGRTAEAQRLEVTLNGMPFRVVEVPADQIEPVTLDLTGKLDASANVIEVHGTSADPMMTQTVATHHIDWKDSDISGKSLTQSRALKLDYTCDKTSAAIMQEVNCSVNAERIGFQGYGMLLAEIGTPPGADVSRESLERAIESDWSISRYDILPDRIIVYMWSKAGGTKFNFKFKPRYGIRAQTPASIVYDYYNPEAQATVAPLRFEVK